MSLWRNEIIRRLLVIFPAEADNGERLIAVLWYLDRQDEVYRGAAVQPPEWISLRMLFNQPAAFEGYARRILELTMQMNEYEEANQARQELVGQLADAQDGNGQSVDPSERSRQNWLMQLLAALVGGTRGIAFVLEDLPWARSLFTSLDDILGMANSSGLLTVLAGIYITCEVAYNMRRWWIGEITGKRCVKNIIDASVSFAGGVAGGFAGGAVGAWVGLPFGPIGIIICGLLGGILGGLAGNYTGKKLSDYLTSRFFNIPREEALENAYVFFGVQQDVTEEELNAALNRARRRYHPDRGGRHEDFLQLQMQWEVIRVAREARRERRQRARRHEQPRANAPVQQEPIALQYY